MSTYAFELPELGEGIETGDVVNVLVAVGDAIAQDQPVLELETDKAVIEVPAPVSGVVRDVHVQTGDKAAVGQLIVTFETEGAARDETPPAREEASAPIAAAEAAPEAPTPEEPASAPAASAPAAEPPSQPAAAVSQAESETAPRPAASAKRGPAPAAPSVRRLAREVGVDINEISGTGPGGRISMEDVKNRSRQLLTATDGHQVAEPPRQTAMPEFSNWGEAERQPMGNVRRATADHMAQAWATVPHVTQHAKADITSLEQLRQRYAPRAETAGGKLTITAIVLKVVTGALRRFPQFNASLDMAKHEIIYKSYYHIGVAVDTDRGLLVPVIRDVDRKSLVDLSVELTEIAERARNRKTTVADLQGGTFTVTNLGGIGGSHFSPIINAPEVAILGLARSVMEPVYIDGQFEPRLMLPLSLSYDHRLIDGADGARFIRWVVEALEQPFLLTLEG